MADRVTYKGYQIVAVPYQLIDREAWTLDVYISRATGATVRTRKFGARSTFNSREDALMHSIEFGVQVIDGKLPSCSVTDL